MAVGKGQQGVSDARRPHVTSPEPDRRSLRVLSPLRDFLRTEAAGGILLVGATVAALAWANSPWRGSYRRLWDQHAAINVGSWRLDLSLQHWVNDALMAVFFFVVGLEIKRELTTGHLSTRRSALLPGIAAVGGMAMPALVYLAIAGSTASRGWAVPMATDIALAIGVVSLAGAAVVPSLRAFLLGLAIVDDIGAIVVIAVVYSSDVGLGLCALAVGVIAVAVILRRVGVRSTLPFVVIAASAWYLLYRAGLHPTLAGVAMGVLAPSEPHLTPDMVDAEELADVSSAEAARTTTSLARSSVSEVEWLEHVLHPWTSFVIVPVFALANAGVEITADGLSAMLGSRLAWGIIAGLLLGKPIGICLAAWIATRSGIADLPESSQPRSLAGVGMAAGIGFTVALFITELAFDSGAQQDEAKLAVLVASTIAGAVALAVLRGLGRHRINV
jgi:Na+:H+ antiporter, NhaA family